MARRPGGSLRPALVRGLRLPLRQRLCPQTAARHHPLRREWPRPQHAQHRAPTARPLARARRPGRSRHRRCAPPRRLSQRAHEPRLVLERRVAQRPGPRPARARRRRQRHRACLRPARAERIRRDEQWQRRAALAHLRGAESQARHGPCHHQRARPAHARRLLLVDPGHAPTPTATRRS